MRLKTTYTQLVELVAAVEHARKLQVGGITDDTIDDAIAWINQHRNMVEDTVPVDVVNFETATAEELLIADWRNAPISLNGDHDYNIRKIQKVENHTLVILLGRTEQIGEDMADVTITIRKTFGAPLSGV